MLAALIIVVVVAIFVIFILSAAIKILREYERGVIFRLGRLLGAPKGPGLFLLIPLLKQLQQFAVKADLLVSKDSDRQIDQSLELIAQVAPFDHKQWCPHIP